MQTKILIADDHQMFREALFNLINGEPDMQVVGQTGSGTEVLALMEQHQPDAICMDINMPGLNGIETTRQLLLRWPQARVIALSAYAESRFVKDMLAAGACAYVTKAEASAELLRALRLSARGKTYLCPDIAAVLGEALITSPSTGTAHVLSPREIQVAQWVATGLTSGQVAERLNIAASTVEVHRRNILRKLEIHSVAELTRYVMVQEWRAP
jgi:two-component system NarL family response regulator